MIQVLLKWGTTSAQQSRDDYEYVKKTRMNECHSFEGDDEPATCHQNSYFTNNLNEEKTIIIKMSLVYKRKVKGYSVDNKYS